MKCTRKIVAALCALSLVAGLTGCQNGTTPTPTPESEGVYTPGTYTGSGTGMSSIVTATVTVDANSITGVSLDVSGETQDIVASHVEEWVNQITKAQSAEIDGVSGATVTSGAIRTAVADALAQASGIASDRKMTAGTYTATAHGAKHDLTVSVTVSADAIETVQITDFSDSPYVGESAVNILPQRIVDKQSIAVDAVTGATLTSSGILRAVSDCLSQAGADLNLWNKKSEVTPAEDVTVDVLVIGGGTSGSTAALAAKTDSSLANVDSGLNVTVVESNGYIGGNSAICGGYIASYFGTSLNEETQHAWTADTLVDSLEARYPEYSEVINDTLMRNIAGLTDDTLNSLMARGFYLKGSDAYLGTSSRLSPDGPAQYTSSSVVADPATGERSGDNGYGIYGGGAFFGKSLTAILEESGVDIRYETTATQLLIDDNGACIGAAVRDHEHTYNIYAKKIILATGYAGFDDKTISQFLTPVYGNVIGAETAANQSFAQKQVAALGGQVNDVHEAISDGHIVLGYNSTLATFGKESLLYNNMNGMLVSTEGTRFTDDSNRGSAVAMQVAELGGKCYMIFDSSHPGVEFYDYLSSNGLAWKADTITALASELGVPADALTATVSKYNEDYSAGADTLFGTPVEKMSPVLTAPFYGVRVNAISTGGIDIAVYTDENLNVTLTNGGATVENLYACGGAGSGNCFILYNIGLGAHVLGCLTSGVYVGNTVRDTLLAH